MPKLNWRKQVPRVLSQDVYRYIANNSNMNQAQVKQCFKLFRMLIEQVAEASHDDDEMEIHMPHIGYFTFLTHKGRKKGETYKMACPKGGCMDITIDEDQPNHNSLKFHVDWALNEYCKNVTREKNRRAMERNNKDE